VIETIAPPSPSAVIEAVDPTLVVSVDELRAVHRLTGLCLPRFVVADDEDDPRVDVAALRGLAARDLVVLSPECPDSPGCPDTPGSPDGGVLLADPLVQLLAPSHVARRIVEIDVEASGVLDRHAVITGEAGTAVVVTEFDGGLVGLRRAKAGEVRRLCGVDEVTELGAAMSFTVCAVALREADELALRGAGPTAVEVLTAAGVGEQTALAWITAVRERTCAVAVAVARSCGDGGPDGPFEIDEMRWLVTGDGTAWRVTAARSSLEEVRSVLTRVTRVTRDELGDALEQVGAGVR
jgi:hypothetical protein